MAHKARERVVGGRASSQATKILEQETKEIGPSGTREHWETRDSSS